MNPQALTRPRDRGNLTQASRRPLLVPPAPQKRSAARTIRCSRLCMGSCCDPLAFTRVFRLSRSRRSVFSCVLPPPGGRARWQCAAPTCGGFCRLPAVDPPAHGKAATTEPLTGSALRALRLCAWMRGKRLALTDAGSQVGDPRACGEELLWSGVVAADAGVVPARAGNFGRRTGAGPESALIKPQRRGCHRFDGDGLQAGPRGAAL